MADSTPTTTIVTARQAKRRRMLIAWAFLLPNFIGFAIFTAGPVLFSLYMAFTDWSLTKHNELTETPPSFIGLQNFQRILWGDESRLFWESFYNTSYMMIGIPIGIAGSLIVALMLNRPIGPKRVTSKVLSATVALVIGVLAAGSSFVLTDPGPIPTTSEMTASLQADQLDTSPNVVNQAIQNHSIQARRSRSVSAAFLILGLVVAAGLLTGVVFFRTLFYLPSLLAGIAMFLLWKSLYKPTGGAINEGLQPVCDTLQSVVTSTPAGLWYALGYITWVVTIGVCGWLIFITLRKFMEGDFGGGSAVGSLLALSVVLALGAGVGYFLCQLPPVAQFATGYAVLAPDAMQSIQGQLLNASLPVDAKEIEITLVALGSNIRPNTLIVALTDMLPADVAGSIVDSIRTVVMGHAEPVYTGLSSGDGLQPPKWLVDESWAKPALILMGVWTAVGGANMLLYLAGLSNIPEELYEAAQIDGAGPWTRFWNVTWPQLAPTTFFIVIMSTIGGLQGGFDQARAMTGGKYGTEVLTYYLYKLAFTDEFQLGLASAVAWVMFGMIFLMTLMNYRFGNRMVND